MKTINKIICMVVPLLAVILAAGTGCHHGDGSGSSYSPGESSGRGGSMARFTVSGDYMYTVDRSTLKVVSIADPSNPIELVGASRDIGSNIETIFTMDNMLFIGSQGAMYIYDISNPQFPTKLSETSHFRSCDPVVAYDTLAFVTLNSNTGWWCGNSNDVLQVYDISEVTLPRRIFETGIPSPRGLAVDGEAGLVFVCNKGGISAYGFEATEAAPGIKLEGKYMSAVLPEVENIDAYDCIALDGTLLVIGADGFYQLGYDDTGFTFISKIGLKR